MASFKQFEIYFALHFNTSTCISMNGRPEQILLNNLIGYSLATIDFKTSFDLLAITCSVVSLTIMAWDGRSSGAFRFISATFHCHGPTTVKND